MNVLVGDLARWWPTPNGSVHISFTIARRYRRCGSALGPILFLVYVNAIDEGITCKILKFATVE